MKYIIQYIQMAAIATGSLIGSFLGGIDGLIYALLTMIVIDYVLGVIIAIINKSLSSSVGFRGIAKKVMILAFVGVGAVIDAHIIKVGSTIRTAVIFFYFANEGISIVENAAVLGLPVPQFLKNILIQLREDGDEGKDDNKDERD